MTTTDIAVRENGHAPLAERDVVDGWITVVADVASLSDRIADTDFVPRALRNKPAAIAACILTGRELGIGPMASLKCINMIQGTPSLSAEYKRARALAAGHQIVIDESNATRCLVRGRRAGSESWVTIQWTLDMAARARISGKEIWRQYPQRMLQARATSELCDLLFPDATLGLPTTEDLEDGVIYNMVTGEVANAVAAPEDAPAPGPRQAQRRQRPPRIPETPTSAAPAAATEPTAARVPAPTAPSGPPLPGEEEDPGPAAPDPGPAAGPGTTGRHQHLVGIVRAHFKRLGFEDDEREQRLATTAVIAGVPADLASTSDLTEEQLSVVADTLAKCKNRERLIVLLTKEDKPRE